MYSKVPYEASAAIARHIRRVPSERFVFARAPTPLQELNLGALRSELGSDAVQPARVWLKREDLSEAEAGGNKLRKLEFVLPVALAENANTIVTIGGEQVIQIIFLKKKINK